MGWETAPTLGVRDVAAALDYYTGKLGFTPTGVYGPEDARVYAVVRRGEAQLHLQIRRRNVWAAARGDYERSAYFYVRDADALHEEFRAAGALILQPPQDMPYGLRELVVRDGDGHRLAFGAERGDDARTSDAAQVREAAPILGCRDVQAAADWFATELGFDCPGGVLRPPGEGAAVYAIVFREGAGVHLQIRRRPVFLSERPSFEGDGYVFVGDADALHTEFAARGVAVLREPQDEPYGLRDFTIATPQGHRLAFGAPLAEPG